MSPIIIPKVIHYCSFGGTSTLDNSTLETWRHYCADYKIMCWNEENFDINYNPYVKQAYDNKKYAFVADVARLWILKNYGGIYLDTDVELTGNFDDFLTHEMFMGFENNTSVCTAVIGSTPNNKIVSELLDEYSDINFNTTTNVEKIGKYLTKNGFDLNGLYIEKNNIAIYPQEYFSPKDFITGKINKTDKTIAIHHFKGSWKSSEEILRDSLFFKIKKYLPEKFAWNLASYISAMKFRGIIQGHKDMFRLLAGKKK